MHSNIPVVKDESGLAEKLKGVLGLRGLRSLILLLLADKLSTETNDGVIRACETIVRAHEAAVVTLNTEYQVCFCRPPKVYHD